MTMSELVLTVAVIGALVALGAYMIAAAQTEIPGVNEPRRRP